MNVKKTKFNDMIKKTKCNDMLGNFPKQKMKME